MEPLKNNIENWSTVKLGDVVNLNPKLVKDIKDENVEVSFLPMKLVEGEINKIHLTETRKYAEVKKGFTPMADDDVIFAKITPCMENGKIAIVHSLKNGIAFGSTEFHVFRCNGKLNNRFLFYYLVQKRFRQEAKFNMTGAVGQRRVPKKFLQESLIPLPAYTQQLAIVSKIEELFSEIENGIKSLFTAKEQLKKYRQSVLKWAFEGKLTNGVNGDLYDLSDEHDLSIAAEPETEYRVERNHNNQKNQKNHSSDEGELPEGWKWVKLGDVIEKPKYGTSKKCSYAMNGIGVLRIPNIVKGMVDSSDLKFAQFDEEEIETYSLKEGDILTIRSNGSVDIVGKCALIRKRDEQFLYAGYLIRLRANQKMLLPKYLANILSSANLRNQIEERAKSTSGVNNINSQELAGLIIPLPSIEQQKKIIEAIESRLSVADKMEESIAESLQQAEALKQSILKKAFEGKLVAS